MSGRRHLFFIPGRRTLGEGIIALRIAKQLHDAGDSISVYGHMSSALLLKDTPFDCDLFDDTSRGFVNYYLEGCILTRNVSSLVLCDLNTTSSYLKESGLSPDMFQKYGVPVVGLDTWDVHESGYTADMFRDMRVKLEKWIGKIPRRLIPSPIVRPVVKPGVYSNLHPPLSVSEVERQDARGQLGLKSADKAIVFTTSKWQHDPYHTPDSRRIGEGLPRLIAYYLAQLGPAVHLIHIGPKAYPLGDTLNDHYHWVSPKDPKSFDAILASADLFLSANIAATTIMRAIGSGIPTMVLGNSCRANSLDEASATLGSAPSEFLRTWVADTVPLYPFSLWPLGWHTILAPLLEKNTYCSAFQMLELLCEKQVVDACWSLLFDQAARDDLRQAQHEYLRQMQSLPTPVEAMDAVLR